MSATLAKAAYVHHASHAPEPRRARPQHLPPAGSSPAGDLQRRLSDAALNGFYAKPAPAVRRLRLPQLALVAGSVTLCWGAVFGAGALLLG